MKKKVAGGLAGLVAGDDLIMRLCTKLYSEVVA
jgi:hypothetical protein